MMQEDELRATLIERIPHFVPEWHYPLPGDAATILVDSLLRPIAQSWTRVEQLPMLWQQFSISLLPQVMPHATPARTFFMVQLMEQAASDVIIPAQTRWRSAQNEAVTFELPEPFSATRSRIAAVFYGDDVLTDSVGAPLPSPAVYVAVASLLEGEREMSVLLSWTAATLPNVYHWNGSCWQPLTCERKTARFVKLTWPDRTMKTTLLNESGYWLKIEQPSLACETDEAPLTFTLPQKWSYEQWMAAKFDERWRSGAPFQPFLRFMVEGDQFYVTHRQLFQAHAATIELEWEIEWSEEVFRTMDEPKRQWKWVMKASEFAEPTPSYIDIERVSLSFWNGTSWQEMAVEGGATLFRSDGAQRATRVVRLAVTEEWRTLLLNGMESVWLRFKVERVTPLGGEYPVYRTPTVQRLAMKLVDDVHVPVERFIVERDGQREWARSPVAFFQSERLPNVRQLFFALTHQPLIEQLSLFCRWARPLADRVPLFRCYVRTKEGWQETTIEDETGGGTSDGRFLIHVPSRWEEAALFNQRAYWLKVTYEAPQPLRLAERWLNAALVVQRRTMESEVVALTYKQDEAYGTLQHAPVIAADVFVDETSSLQPHEYERLHAAGQLIERGSGTKRRVFVRWERVKSLRASSFYERHYTLNEASGQLLFRHHHLLKEQRFEPVLVRYEHSQLEEGNRKADDIGQPEQVVPFLEETLQPFAAFGGARWSETPLVATSFMTEDDIVAALLHRFPALAEVKLVRELDRMLVVCRSRADEDEFALRLMTANMKRFLVTETALSYWTEEKLHIVSPTRCLLHVHSAVQIAGATLPFQLERRLNERLATFFSGAINEALTEMALKQFLFQDEAVGRIHYLYVVVEVASSGAQLNLTEVQQLPHFSLHNGHHTFQFVME